MSFLVVRLPRHPLGGELSDLAEGATVLTGSVLNVPNGTRIRVSILHDDDPAARRLARLFTRPDNLPPLS